MAGLTSPLRMICVGATILALTWPSHAFAGWFVRNNQIAYRLTQEGHDSQALKYWDESAEGLYGRGTALMHLGRMQEAEQTFRESLEVAPHKTGFSDRMEMPANIRPHFMASLWYNLGNTLYAQGELRKARQAWIKALSFEPGHTKARHNLEIVDRLLGSREHANQANLAGMNGKKQKAARQTDQQASADQQQQQQHGLLSLPLPGAQRHESGSASGNGTKNGDAHSLANSGQGSGTHIKQIASHSSSSVDKHASSQQADASHDGHQADVQGMSRRQAILELRMVEEGVSVFLRHRLGEKGPSGTSADGGKPW